MPLDIATLVNDLVELQTDMEAKNEDAKVEYATRLAGMIRDFVMSGTVTTTVATTGTATAQTGTGTGWIS